MGKKDNGAKTLDELDPPAWGESTYDSYLVKTCHRLRRKPIGMFTVEDLRIMIGQDIGLRVLVPRALDFLEPNPLVQGDFFPGDLLASVLQADSDFWQRDRESRDRTEATLRRTPVLPTEVIDALSGFREAIGRK